MSALHVRLLVDGSSEHVAELAVALQVPFAAHRRTLAVETLRIEQSPVPAARAACTGALIVGVHTAFQIGCPSDIGADIASGIASQNVNETGGIAVPVRVTIRVHRHHERLICPPVCFGDTRPIIITFTENIFQNTIAICPGSSPIIVAAAYRAT